MEIERINTYNDKRFSKRVLLQHGCFLVNGTDPYEVEILSEYEAAVRGKDESVYPAVIAEFRFYTPHITTFRDASGHTVLEYPRVPLLTLSLDQIQPSQFYVDLDKVAAIRTFIHKPEEIIIQVLPHEGRYIALDGHTRLYYAVQQGWTHVRAVAETSDAWVHKFVAEAQRRGIRTPGELQPVCHSEYEEKWNRFCDAFFAKNTELT